MSVLYVIGNGFDLWHGLPTSYSDFYRLYGEDLERNSEYFSLGKGPLWHNFEDDLGRFDWSSFYDNHNYTDPMADNFRPSEVYGLEDDLNQQADELVNHIDQLFSEWIESIEVIEMQAAFAFVDDARYLSFNYTPLLTSLYGIRKESIFHIHGCVKDGDVLIYGHGRDIQPEDETDDEGNSNRHMFSDSEAAAKYPLYKFRKPVDEIIEREQNYFQNLNRTGITVILGHSLNDIDLPYFRKIHMTTPDSQWVVSYHEDEAEHHLTQLEKCGVPSDRIILSNIEAIPSIIECLSTRGSNNARNTFR